MSYAPRFMPKPGMRAVLSLVISMGCVASGAACSVAIEGSVSVGEQGRDASMGVGNTPSPSASLSSEAPVADASAPPARDAAPPQDAGPKGAVATVGRWDLRDTAGPRAGWPGSVVRFRFVGTGASVKFTDTPGRGGASEWDVAIDGQWQTPKLVLAPGTASYEVARGLPNKEHAVELFRRNEGLQGSTQLLGVTIPGGTLLPAPPARARTFEFLGDSLTNGYGIEGIGPRCSYSAATQNFHRSFASRLAQAFDADTIAVAYQGKGLIKNYERGTAPLFPELYGRTLPDDATSLWDPRRVSVDAVFVMLGANDYSQEKAQVYDPPNFVAFRTAYETLLQRVRTNAPTAHVIALVGPTMSDASPTAYYARTDQVAAVTEAVANRTAAGDTRVHFVSVAQEPSTELSACDYHPSVAVHERLANALVPEVRRITGF